MRERESEEELCERTNYCDCKEHKTKFARLNVRENEPAEDTHSDDEQKKKKKKNQRTNTTTQQSLDAKAYTHTHTKIRLLLHDGVYK